MPATGNHLRKLMFRFYSHALDKWMTETLWADVINEEANLYKLNNIPFFAAVAPGDIVHAPYSEKNQMPTCSETVEYSGNSLIQVIMMDDSIMTNNVRDIFNAMGCPSEKYKEGYFVVEIPAEKDYGPVREQLQKLQAAGTIDYAEPVLSVNHDYE